ncbi:unnamed protein product, partial [Mesorhabditis spiculigera]
MSLRHAWSRSAHLLGRRLLLKATTSPSTFAASTRQLSISPSLFEAAEPFKPTPEGEKKREDQQRRRNIAIGASLFIVWVSTHGLLLWRRRRENRTLNKDLPPIDIEEFVTRYLSTGKVNKIVYQPAFNVANVYLSHPDEPSKAKAMAMFSYLPDQIARPPDVRFDFDEGFDSLKLTLEAAMKAFFPEGNAPQFSVENDQFPSMREFGFIFLATLFTLAALMAGK